MYSESAARRSRRARRALWALVALVAAVASGCGDDDGEEASAASAPSTAAVTSAAAAGDAWTFTDDRGVTMTLPERPERIVAYVGTAAALWDFGIRPVGVFGPQRQPDGTPEPAAGNLDLDTVESAGEDWEGLNLEALAALDPDLVVSGGVDAPWVIADQLDVIADIAPVAIVEVYRDSADAIISNYERLAVALGADPASPELVEARAAFDGAAERVRAAATAKPGLTVLATYADVDGLYIAKPKDFPDLLLFRELGVDVTEPGGPEDYWEQLSWEQANRYPADLLLHDVRSFSLQPDVLAAEQPTWAALPAVQAGQIAGWSAETVLSYQGFAVALDDVAAAIDASRADIV